jgi:acyl-CoA synthetase (AMP-forming)/AMP-acid ligase II
VFQPVFNAAGSLTLIRQHGVTSLIAVPAMIISLLEASQSNQPERSGNSTTTHSGSSTPANSGLAQRNSCPISMRRSLSKMAAYLSMRVVLLGGGELHGRLRGPLQVLFPNAQITEAYGMTEACSSMTFRSLDVLPCTAALSVSSQHSGSSAATRAGQIIDRKQLELVDQRAGSMVSASAGASRHGDKSGAGAIPVGWPPPGIEMGIAPVSEAATGACGEPPTNDTEVGQTQSCLTHCTRMSWNLIPRAG